MSQQTPTPTPRRAWWPLFAKEKAIIGQESIIGWFDDLRVSRQPLSAIAARAKPVSLPKPVPVAEDQKLEAIEARETIVEPAEPVAAPKLEPVAPEPIAPEPEAEAPPAPPALEGELAEPETQEAVVAEVIQPEPVVEVAPVEQAPVVEPEPVEPPPAEPEPAIEEPAPKVSLWSRLKSGLKRTSDSLSSGIGSIFGGSKIDEAALEDLEDLLITSDLGVGMATRLTDAVRDTKSETPISGDEVRQLLAGEVLRVLNDAEKPLEFETSHAPHVVLVVGVNGAGKTTTIGKIAHKLHSEGKSVMLAAGDTFRAAAIDQLKVWGDRVGAEVIAKDVGADSAGLAFEALEKAKEQNIDVLLIDTAGRLQNKTELMAELEKVIRVIRKLDDTAPHSVVQVLDATVGQNAISQVEAFHRVAGVTGLVMTKLDGTARGGILVPLTEKFGLPIHAIGVGEAVEDLQPFNAELFAKALAGIEDAA